MESTASKLIGLVYAYHHGTWRFIRAGKAQFAGVCLLSFVFIVARCLMAFLCLRFLGIGNSTVGDVLQIQMALLFLLYFAPTPGSSGFAEVFSLSAMAAIVPAGLAPYYNLVWRASTVYLPAGLGLLFLVLTVLRDTRNILRRRVRPHVSRSESPNAVKGSFNARIPLRNGESFHHGPFPVSAHGGSRLPKPIYFGGTRSVRSFPSCRVSDR